MTAQKVIHGFDATAVREHLRDQGVSEQHVRDTVAAMNRMERGPLDTSRTDFLAADYIAANLRGGRQEWQGAPLDRPIAEHVSLVYGVSVRTAQDWLRRHGCRQGDRGAFLYDPACLERIRRDRARRSARKQLIAQRSRAWVYRNRSLVDRWHLAADRLDERTADSRSVEGFRATVERLALKLPESVRTHKLTHKGVGKGGIRGTPADTD